MGWTSDGVCMARYGRHNELLACQRRLLACKGEAKLGGRFRACNRCLACLSSSKSIQLLPADPLTPLEQGAPGSDQGNKRYKRRTGRRDGERAAKKQRKGHEVVASRRLADVSNVGGGLWRGAVRRVVVSSSRVWLALCCSWVWGPMALLLLWFAHPRPPKLSPAEKTHLSPQVEVESDVLSGFKIWFANTKGYK